MKSKALRLQWHVIHSDKPVANGNILGKAMAMCKNTLRKVPFQEFENKSADAIEKGLDNLNKQLPEFHETLRNTYCRAKILYFSETGDNILMWSHYAEQHKGLVLKFRHIQDSVWGAAMPVAYPNEMPRLVEEDELIDMFGGEFSLTLWR